LLLLLSLSLPHNASNRSILIFRPITPTTPDAFGGIESRIVFSQQDERVFDCDDADDKNTIPFRFPRLDLNKEELSSFVDDDDSFSSVNNWIGNDSSVLKNNNTSSSDVLLAAITPLFFDVDVDVDFLHDNSDSDSDDDNLCFFHSLQSSR
tara:strand:- start:46 stop:498 length:453 start_codon:yes stop_codon:yes gene_type:complete